MRSMHATLSLAVVAAVALVPNAASAAPEAASKPLAKVHTAGRVEVAGGTLQYSWPGVYFEGRFWGTGVGVVLNDANNDYEIQVDGATVATLVLPGQTTHWVTGLARGRHTVRLVKRTESPWAVSEFGGFVAAPGGVLLGKPAARSRQIEFIGDSNTVGYGNMSTTRECTGEEVHRTTNADRSFGALIAKRLNADYQINAFSGLGMVRNYNGGSPEVNYRTYYDRALLSVDGDVWPKPRGWQPQLVVVGLGLNDFSTAINAGEPWTPDTLIAAYREAYHGFLDKLRARYGPRTTVVVAATSMWNTTALADAAQQVVSERDDRVRYFLHDTTGWDALGCHWHPSAHDHELMADRLGAFVATLPIRW